MARIVETAARARICDGAKVDGIGVGGENLLYVSDTHELIEYIWPRSDDEPSSRRFKNLHGRRGKILSCNASKSVAVAKGVYCKTIDWNC
jgi:hypothetical protein